MKTRSIIHAAFAAVILTVMASCTADGGSIYYILENEQKQPPSTLGSTITAFDVARLGTTYYAAAYTIFKGLVGGGDQMWVQSGVTNPITNDKLPVSGARCNALAAFPPLIGNLFGAFSTDTGSLGLYRANVDDFSTAGGGFKITAAGLDTQQIIRLIVSNGELLIVSASPTGLTNPPYNYCLTTTANGTAFTQLVTAADGVTSMIRDAVRHTTGTYFAVSGNNLLSGTVNPLGSTNVLGTYTIAAANTLQGIHSNGTNIVISSKSGGVYISADSGVNWTNVAADTQSGSAVSYLGIAGPLAGSNNLIIGSEGYGYYYLTPLNVLTHTNDTTMKTLKLYTAVVLRFSVDAAESTVFACTAGYGLWRGAVDGGSDSGVNTASWKIQ